MRGLDEWWVDVLVAGCQGTSLARCLVGLDQDASAELGDTLLEPKGLTYQVTRPNTIGPLK